MIARAIRIGDIVRTPLKRVACVKALARDRAQLVYLDGRLREPDHRQGEGFVCLPVHLLELVEED